MANPSCPKMVTFSIVYAGCGIELVVSLSWYNTIVSEIRRHLIGYIFSVFLVWKKYEFILWWNEKNYIHYFDFLHAFKKLIGWFDF